MAPIPMILNPALRSASFLSVSKKMKVRIDAKIRNLKWWTKSNVFSIGTKRTLRAVSPRKLKIIQCLAMASKICLKGVM